MKAKFLSHLKGYCLRDKQENHEILLFPFPEDNREIVIMCFSKTKELSPLYLTTRASQNSLMLFTNFTYYKEDAIAKIKNIFCKEEENV